MEKRFLSFISLALIIFLMSSCFSSKLWAEKITIESAEIPPDMKTEDFVIIGVLKGIRRYDDFLKNEFSRYTGTYVLSEKINFSSKYHDANKYRYFLDCNVEATYGPGTGAGGVIRFYIYDRKTDKKYVRKSASTLIKKEIRAYLLAIDSIRKK